MIPSRPTLSRRSGSIRLWRGARLIIGVASLACAVRAFWWEPSTLIVAEQRIPLQQVSRGSVRIAVLTDLHVGSPFNGPAKLRDVVERTNAARADIICILGDLVIQGVLGGRFVPPEPIASELKRLRAPAGVFAVLGNHDGPFCPSAFPSRPR